MDSFEASTVLLGSSKGMTAFKTSTSSVSTARNKCKAPSKPMPKVRRVTRDYVQCVISLVKDVDIEAI